MGSEKHSNSWSWSLSVSSKMSRSLGYETTPDFEWLDPLLHTAKLTQDHIDADFLKEGYLYVMEKLAHKHDETSTLDRAMSLVRKLSDPSLLVSSITCDKHHAEIAHTLHGTPCREGLVLMHTPCMHVCSCRGVGTDDGVCSHRHQMASIFCFTRTRVAFPTCNLLAVSLGWKTASNCHHSLHIQSQKTHSQLHWIKETSCSTQKKGNAAASIIRASLWFRI